ncbi:MAG: hypothetical protein P2A85_18440 [Microcoleus anatoxicus]|uniref:hypothetical protein n=1 Tax=Microcoleus anatoxicus TaxID=2705319 RepID=UPI003672FE3C
MENHRVKSSTRAPSGFCLCRRGFNRRGFWVSTAGFLWMGDRIFGFQPPGFLWMGDRFFVDRAIEFERNVRSGFWVDGGDRVFC